MPPDQSNRDEIAADYHKNNIGHHFVRRHLRLEACMNLGIKSHLDRIQLRITIELNIRNTKIKGPLEYLPFEQGFYHL
jgi:hypothetical protein